MDIPGPSSPSVNHESATSPSSLSQIVTLLSELHEPFQCAQIRFNPGVIAFLQSIDSLLQVIQQYRPNSLSSELLATALSLIQEYQKPVHNPSEPSTVDLTEVSHRLEQVLSIARSIAGIFFSPVVTR